MGKLALDLKVQHAQALEAPIRLFINPRYKGNTMERTLSSAVAEHIGKKVTIKGWLHKKRLMGGLTFINVRDRTGCHTDFDRRKS